MYKIDLSLKCRFFTEQEPKIILNYAEAKLFSFNLTELCIDQLDDLNIQYLQKIVPVQIGFR